jgi:hypothetical protein
MKLDPESRECFYCTERLLNEISVEIKPISKKKKQKVHVIFLCIYFLVTNEECQSIFSRSKTRKIFSLLNSQYIDREGRLKVLKAACSLGEHICIDFILHHKNLQQLVDKLRSVFGLRDGQFLQIGLIFFQIMFFYLNRCLLI